MQKEITVVLDLNRKYGLTLRELDVLRLIASGKTNPQIAEKLTISVHTVRTHRKNIRCKTNCHNAANITCFAYENGILEKNTPESV